jgi:hypothetical protein
VRRIAEPGMKFFDQSGFAEPGLPALAFLRLISESERWMERAARAAQCLTQALRDVSG